MCVCVCMCVCVPWQIKFQRVGVCVYVSVCVCVCTPAARMRASISKYCLKKEQMLNSYAYLPARSSLLDLVWLMAGLVLVQTVGSLDRLSE